MHLKSLTVRGFKSFASATTFDFEPGVTAVVGPNGSGKSNVVDALAWVMGEQGAKTLRGGKMEDIIFAGTAARPPLGRAHVSLTIDNSDGALPIDYNEVTISRTLFRTGGSEYAINSSPARLLDIQELLSDSGLGREMHVIVGQGQLDKILHATPEDRRGFIEEAAGILKHRRRKEKTLRKLEGMAANLARLGDLSAEIRRQLTPLGKQAEVARRAQTVQFDVRDARARLLADDLVQLVRTVAREEADETAVKERRAAVDVSLSSRRRRQAELEEAAAAAVPVLNAARDNWYQLAAAKERLRALGVLATERRRLLAAAAPQPDPSRDPDRLAQQAGRLRAEAAALAADIAARGTALAEAVTAKAATEDAARAEDARLTALLRATADRREGLAKLAGVLGSAQSRAESAQAEIGRLAQAAGAGEERRRAAAAQVEVLDAQLAGAVEARDALGVECASADAALAAVLAEVAGLTERQHDAERRHAALTARVEALSAGLRRKDGTAALLAAGQPGVLSAVSDLLGVDAGHESAIAAALGAAAGAVAVVDVAAAVAALDLVKAHDGGRLSLLVAGTATAGTVLSGTSTVGELQPLPVPSSVAAALAGEDGSLPAAAVVRCPAALAASVGALLDEVVLVQDLAQAARLVARHPQLTAVTADGDVLGAWKASGGSAGAPSLLELAASVDEAAAALAEVSVESDRIRAAQSGAMARRAEAQSAADGAQARLRAAQARYADAAGRLGQLGATLRSAEGESGRAGAAQAAAVLNLTAAESAVAEAAARLAAAQAAPVEEEPSTDRRDGLALAATAARAAEMEARLGLRSAQEQHTAVGNRAGALERTAATERLAREQAAERARRRAFAARKAAAVATAAEHLLRCVDLSLAVAGRDRDAAEEARTHRDAELAGLRIEAAGLEQELSILTDSVHRDELARAATRSRIEALEAKALEDLGLTADHLVAEYGPDVPVPAASAGPGDKWAALRVPVDGDGEELREGTVFVRAEQEARLKQAQRDLAALGKVNPLALEEFAALEERHLFLSSQLEDLRSSRRDLLAIIKEVDARVEQVFRAAFADTAVQFERVFATLFPGGEGRLVLTDPANMLTTGIEVEARPAGKKIKRLSLLSGGERSLTAVALLVAIFKARPSPFYVMDEVEAALDDTNLGRLLTIFRELRESSQLIIITHQKRTMEVADALYGVTMRGDGVSTVISQRLAE
ncbi:chromosome segregation protein SMC [Pseudarthrobacter sp. P1]|uniref:chromosome segregation protein SMC n=1 Tax=Pseudarthrobacter sp. P1 TaxID=3418418 RepID=UPI003CEB3B06